MPVVRGSSSVDTDRKEGTGGWGQFHSEGNDQESADYLKKNGGVITSALNLSSLTKISDRYTQGHIMKAVKALLTERRIDQLAKKPLTGAEYVVHLAKIDPVFKEEVEAFKAK
ncbi:dynein regulatory complex protein 11-like isoform X2 [Acipenser ruthenus]|uniref:dynein regulatory complex protein 11-like isoform X2 n=1 Tax=Acipenser ruthenus TaxID=7906 RepID=UPI0027409522|nr:dynein regulatory complex protein 11-like isoform X2 [Acipenser ruthenus]